MRGVHTFFIVGSIGFAVTALLHMLVSFLTGSARIDAWASLYLVWGGFMLVGLMQTMRQTKRGSIDPLA